MKQQQSSRKFVSFVWDEIFSFIIAVVLFFYILEGIKLRSDLRTLVKTGHLQSTMVELSGDCGADYDIWMEAPKEFVRMNGNKGNFRVRIPIYARTAHLNEPVKVSVSVFCGHEFHSIESHRYNITKSWWTPTLHIKNKISPSCHPFMFDMNVTLLKGCGDFRLQGHEINE
jgi:hypothetical protein